MAASSLTQLLYHRPTDYLHLCVGDLVFFLLFCRTQLGMFPHVLQCHSVKASTAALVWWTWQSAVLLLNTAICWWQLPPWQAGHQLEEGRLKVRRSGHNSEKKHTQKTQDHIDTKLTCGNTPVPTSNPPSKWLSGFHPHLTPAPSPVST